MVNIRSKINSIISTGEGYKNDADQAINERNKNITQSRKQSPVDLDGVDSASAEEIAERNRGLLMESNGDSDTCRCPSCGDMIQRDPGTGLQITESNIKESSYYTEAQVAPGGIGGVGGSETTDGVEQAVGMDATYASCGNNDCELAIDDKEAIDMRLRESDLDIYSQGTSKREQPRDINRQPKEEVGDSEARSPQRDTQQERSEGLVSGDENIRRPEQSEGRGK